MLLIVAIACFLPLATPRTHAPREAQSFRYSIEELITPYGLLRPQAINNSGQIVGSVQYKHHKRAFLLDNGVLKILPALRGIESEASAISGTGIIAGTSHTRVESMRAVIWVSGKIKPLRFPKSDVVEVKGVNNRGDVVGEFYRRYLPWAFISVNGRIQTHVRLPGGLYLREAIGINNRGVICGRCGTGGEQFNRGSLRVCLWESSGLSQFGRRAEVLAGPIPVAINDQNMVVGNVHGLEDVQVFTIKNGKYESLQRDYFHYAWGLNNRGQYVGEQCTGNIIQQGPYRATLWRDGRKYDLNDSIPEKSGWVLEKAYAINDNGVIAGTGRYHGRESAFILKPLISTAAGGFD